MTTTVRSTLADCDRLEAYDATLDVIEPFVERHAFKVGEDREGEVYAIGWQGPLTSAHYLFTFRPVGSRMEISASLRLGRAFGPLQHLLRRRGNRAHLDRILHDIKALAEAETESIEDDALAADVLETDAGRSIS